MRETSDFRMYYYAEKNNFGGAVLCFTNLSCDRLGDTPGGLLWPVFEPSLRGRYTLRKHYLRNQATYMFILLSMHYIRMSLSYTSYFRYLECE